MRRLLRPESTQGGSAGAAQAPVASTRGGVRATGRTDIGTLEPGKPLADTGNLRRVALVARAGELWTRKELEYR